MSALETLPIRAQIYIPENKVSAWVSKKGQDVKKDRDKEFQGVWVADCYTLDKRKPSDEIWIFYDDDEKGIDRRVLENNPLQGSWGYAPEVEPRKAEIQDMWFFPPKSARCKVSSKFEDYNHKGTWIKPVFKRDFSQLGSNSSGFMTVSGNMRIAKGEKHSIGGKWNMLGFNDDVVRGKKKKKTDDDGKKGPFEIFVRKVDGSRFPISVIPGNKISDCKKKIHSKKRIPIEDQRLSFKEVPLKDQKTVVGSGIRNGDTIDLGPMIVYVRTRRGKKFTFEVDQEESVDNMKKLVEKREGTPAKEQRLYFKNDKLKDEKSLSDYKVRHKSTLDLGPMVIFVQPNDGRPKIELDVEPTDTLKSVKTQVKNRSKIPVSDQRLYFEEEEMLKDSKNLASYNVYHLDTLFMRDSSTPEPKNEPSMNEPSMIIFVIKEWDNHKFKLRTDPTNTILDIKKMIEASENIPVDQQRLTFKKKSVYNTKTLEQSKIKNRSILHLAKPRETGRKRPEIIPTPIIPEEEPSEPIEVKTPDGRSFFMDFDPENDTVDDLKAKVAKLAEIPIKDLALLDPDDEIVDDDYDMPRQGVVLDVAPQVEVVLPDKTKVKVVMLPKMTFEDLKDVVEEKTGVPKADQRIFFFDNEGNELDDKVPMQKADVTPYSVLEMRPPPPPPEPMEVKTPDGRSFFMDFDPENDTVDDLKNKVAKLAEIPIKDLALIDEDDDIVDDDYDMPRQGVVLDVAPQIEVVLPDKTKVKVTMLPQMTFEDLKDVVEEKTGVPKADQCIFFFDNEGNELDDKASMQKVGIQPDTMLEMRSPPPPIEPIQVKAPDGRSFFIDFDRDTDTVDDLKNKVAKLTEIPVKDLALIDEDDDIVDDDGYDMPRQDVVLDVAPQIEVVLPDKSKIKVTMLPKMTFEDVKDVVEEKTGVPKAEQRIFFFDNEGNELDDSAPMQKAGIQPGSVLEMRPPPPPPKEEKIELKLPGGRSFFFDFDPEDSSDDVKEKIARQFGVPVKDLPPLMLDDEEFDDDDDYHPSRGDVFEFEPSEIEVELPNKKRVKMSFLPIQTIGEIKDIVEEETGVPRSDQRIFYFDNPDEEVDDDVMLKKAKIGEGPLKIFPPIEKKEPKEIKIKDPNGRLFEFTIEPEDSVGDVKRRLKKIGIPVGCFKLEDGVWDDVDDDDSLDAAHVVRNGGVLEVEPPEIEVALPNSKKIKIKILPAMTMKDINDIIELEAPELSTIDKRSRCFFFDDSEELDDDTPFDKLKFDHGKTLEMRAMMIKVQHSDGRTFELNVQTDWYIDDIRDQVHKLANIAPEKQNFSFNGELVEEELSLIKQGIVHNSTLIIEPMIIYVNVPHKKKPVPLIVRETSTVEAIKRKAVKKMNKGKKWRNYCLMTGGQELANDETVGKCNIQHEDRLTLEAFKVRIMHWSSDMIDLDGIERTSTITSVKKQIHKSEGIPIEHLRLSSDGRSLRDIKTLEEENVKHRTTLVLEPPDADLEMERADKRSVKTTKQKKFTNDFDEIMPIMPDWDKRIFFFDYENQFDAYIELVIMHWTGEKFTLDKILLKRKVSEIKKMISKREGIKRNKQILKFDGKVLNDKRTLLDHGVGHRSILVLESPEKNRIVNPNVERLNGIFSTLPTRQFITSINIQVEHWNGDTFDLSPGPNDYIDDIKDSLFDLTGISQERLRLSFNGQQTDDTLNLKEHDIVDGSTLVLDPMQIMLQLPTWKKPIALNVEMEQTIAQVKKRIAKKYRMPLEALCIMFGGNELTNSRTLEDCGVEHEDQIKVETYAINIMHWSGEKFFVHDMSPKFTTFDLKNRIAEVNAIPITEQTLIFKGKILNDVLRLRDQGVHHKAILILDPPERILSPLQRKVKLTLFTDSKAENDEKADTAEESAGIDKIYFGDLREEGGDDVYSTDDNLSMRSSSTRSSKTSSTVGSSTSSKKRRSKEKREKKKKKEKSKNSKSEKSATKDDKSKRRKDSKKNKTTMQ